MKETEITVQVFNDIDEIDKILQRQGFSIIENYKMKDWYFSKYDNIIDLKYTELINQSFLVRELENEIQLCYKNKEYDQHGNVISEEKIKTKLSDLHNALQVFKMAHLNNYCIVENNSYVYQKNDICFVIQIIKDLGIFLEYEEDDSMKDMSAQEKFTHMCNIVKNLDLKIGKDFSCKKVDMLLHPTKQQEK